MAIEIVSFPIKDGDFPVRKMLVYQRVSACFKQRLVGKKNRSCAIAGDRRLRNHWATRRPQSASKVPKFYETFRKDADVLSKFEGVHANLDRPECGPTEVGVISFAASLHSFCVRLHQLC